MIVLRLTDSADRHPVVPDERKSRVLAAAAAEAATGEPVQTFLRTLWPSKDLPALLDRWLAEYRPDFVLLTVSPYWFTAIDFPAPRRAKSQLIRSIGRAAKRFGVKSELVYRAGKLRRRVLVRRGVGREFFEPAEVIAVVEATLRRILRHEQIGLAVRGPMYPVVSADSAALFAREEGRRLEVHRAVSALCAGLHVPYYGVEDGAAFRKTNLASDDFHPGEAAHAAMAAEESEAYIAWWREQRT